MLSVHVVVYMLLPLYLINLQPFEYMHPETHAKSLRRSNAMRLETHDSLLFFALEAVRLIALSDLFMNK